MVNRQMSRRQVLKGTSTVVALSAFSTASTASSSFHIGSTRFLETKVEYGGIEGAPVSTRCGLGAYSYDRGNNIITLTGASLEPFKASAVISTGMDFHPLSQPVRLTTHDSQIPNSTDYRRLRVKYHHLRQTPPVPTFEARVRGGEFILNFDSTKQTISPGEESTFRVNSLGFSTPVDSEKQHISPPRISVRNHGKVDVYGDPNARILPLNSNDPYAQSRIETLLGVSRDEVKIDQAHDLLVVREGGR